MLKYFIGLLLLPVVAITVPEIRPRPDETFIISFEPGAVGACTVFTQISGEGRPYEPRSCWWFGDQQIGSYTDDWDLIRREDAEWDVYAEIEYVDKSGKSEVVETNHLKVHR